MLDLDVLQNLADIDNIDLASSWPWAIGYWAVILLSLLFLVLFVIFFIKHKRYKSSWQYVAYKNLLDLEKNIIKNKSNNPEFNLILKQKVQKLSEELRKIAFRSYSRENCAGLSGNNWLRWLTEKDPQGYNWQQHGVILLKAPYSPKVLDSSLDLFSEKIILDTNKILELIVAAKKWVRKC